MTLLSRFVSPDNPEFHSHAIAKADDFQASTIGSTDKSTFKQRKSIEHNRTMVGGYQSAGVHDDLRREANNGSPSTVPARLAVAGETRAAGSPFRRQERSSGVPARFPGASTTPAPRPQFAEPQTRRYNPYS